MGIAVGAVAQRIDMEPGFGLKAAARLMTETVAPWVQELGFLIESVEAARPAGAGPDWLPGVQIRLPFTPKICRDGKVACPQALMTLTDVAMSLACAAACNGHRPMTTMDQTLHFLRPVNFDVIADARIVRLGRNTSFGRVNLYAASDKRPVGMASSAYAML